MIQIAKAESAIRLIDGDAVQAKLAHAGPQFITGEPVIGVNFGS